MAETEEDPVDSRGVVVGGPWRSKPGSASGPRLM